MATYIINLLVKNEAQNLRGYFDEATKLWNEIWENPSSETVEGLSKILFNEQLSFEAKCGGLHLGQEIMVYSGFGMLYDPVSGGNEEKLQLLSKAFKESHCSFEVTAKAQSAADMYYVD
ncbi:hypothetical protein ANABIO32_00740 [Rossellomorea marisflavi]|uniref:hypothetical protein n=1 Tax=Rossellomorea marisflavi TaxID=189381 RepID=UPI0025C7D0FD|nr:hypothetical protein [Rossellomorea marisflavi]GLI82388.1 hypothetical protein ANABIO32_00740 [Rossellomorea marisflavi]